MLTRRRVRAQNAKNFGPPRREIRLDQIPVFKLPDLRSDSCETLACIDEYQALRTKIAQYGVPELVVEVRAIIRIDAEFRCELFQDQAEIECRRNREVIVAVGEVVNRE